ncbi:LRR domain containing protein, partial [Parasponia andersonii]
MVRIIKAQCFVSPRATRVLNLSRTLITSLPNSVYQIRELRALLLRDFYALEMLPKLGAFHELQVRDLCETRIRELPEGFGRLTNLRKLNLSRTHHLENIEAVSISGLSSLEILDMSFSASKLDMKRKVELEREATFDELITLERLSVLHIRLDSVGCLALGCNWLRQLRQFNIRISRRNCESSYLPAPLDEKRVILRGVNLLERSLEGLLCPAIALDLVTCRGIIGLSDIVAKKSLKGLSNLKSLTISSCDCLVSLLDGDVCSRSTLPNLERLTLSRLKNLKILLERISPRGCLGRLKIIEVVDCPRLNSLISFALLRFVPNLEEINAVTWRGLEIIEVSNCPKLLKLPLLAYDALSIKEIRGDSKWWNSL